MNSTSTVFRQLARTRKSQVILKIVSENLIWFLLVLCLIVMAVISRTFFSRQNLINLAVNSTALGLLVIAESLCLIVGKLDISIESTLAFSALIGALLVKSNINPFDLLPLPT